MKEARRFRVRPAYLAGLLGLALVVGLPQLVTSRYGTNLLILGAAWGVVALGMTVVLGYTGQISLTQAAFYGIGAYAVALLTTRAGWSWWPALLVGMALAALAGVLLGMTTLKLGGHYLAMVTISFQIIFTLVLANWIPVTGGPDGISGIKRPSLGPIALDSATKYAYFALGILFLVAVLVAWLKHTALGRAMRAVRENELAAEALGVDTLRVKVTAFTLSALLGALGGAVYAAGFLYISPDSFNFDISVEFLAMALAGGADSTLGTILGASLLTFLPEWLRELKNIYLVVYGLIIILVIVFMPDGLWGYVNLALRRVTRPEPVGKASRGLRVGGSGAPGEPILEVQGLVKHFGGLRAVDGVDFTVRRGEIHALIGPNGSGKTTVINLLSGVYVPTAGSIRFLGEPIVGLRPNRIARRGLTRTFQNIRLFRELTVWENVLVGSQRAGGGEAEVRERALAAIEFVGLQDRVHEVVKSLPYGHQKLVELARTLAGEPQLLLLDEPAAGLNQTEKQELVALLRRLHGMGLTMLVVEHDMSIVAQLADTITVLNFGRKIAEGHPAQVLHDPVVVEAYLGNREVALGA
ncbi:branched-chain amino acid ABC transporter ATP-binding protein/permease [Caldinitratiruptor microaerophilus]|uniref:Metal-dependent hydrolase n=1 Tax=Caldinitratiruptor microaerophilus TaxID=671077 RepID=A0AA35CJ34_9FIRM|nr:branched-chain amino acid ABC transporter ATP-binding protein/permease [Caldinitratiruptor microaerophilus]BDG60180.1 metal-dependent hydrolase [Caldinitratiruptor microaerophilus]